jgi:hypothetical protein
MRQLRHHRWFQSSRHTPCGRASSVSVAPAVLENELPVAEASSM